MKVAVYLVLVGVAAVSSMPQEPTPVPEPMPAMEPVTDEQVTKMVQMKNAMERSMMLYKICMMKDVMKNCGCTTPDCEVIKSIMSCHYYMTRAQGFYKRMPDEMLMKAPHKFDDSMITDAQCEMLLPPPKHLIKMALKENAEWQTTLVCMAKDGLEEQYRTCVLPAAYKFLSYDPKKDQ